MGLLITLSSTLYILIIAMIFRSLLRSNTKFWVFFALIEYFYIIGLGIYPLMLLYGAAKIPVAYSAYSGIYSFSPISFFHIISYAVGAFLGFYCTPIAKLGSGSLIKWAKKVYISPERLILVFSVVAICAALLYIHFVGFTQAVLGASFKRSGDFEFFANGSEFAFLTRFVLLGLFSVATYPYFASGRKSIYLVTFAIFLIGLLAYVFTVSRYAILEAIILPVAILWSYNAKRSFLINAVLLAGLVFGTSFMLFGKAFLPVFSNYIFGHGAFDKSALLVNADVFGNFSHLLFSIDAGIKHFFDHGPWLAKDILLSPLGFIPSSFYNNAGAGFLSYQNMSLIDRMACVNTSLIARGAECMIPPYYTGVSAYVFPLVGGTLFGFVRFATYSVINRAWERLHGSMRFVPMILLMFLSAEQLMLFIPSTIALVTFLWMVLGLIWLSGRIVRRRS